MTDSVARAADLIAPADQALVRTVDGSRGPPGPTLAAARLDARARRGAPDAQREGLAGVLHGVHVHRPQPTYASPEGRDADIATLATAEPGELRDRLLASTAVFARALAAMHEDDWDGRFERTPGGPDFALVHVPLMRVREVEIHHADLGAGYTAADWPAGFRRAPARLDDQAGLPPAVHGATHRPRRHLALR